MRFYSCVFAWRLALGLVLLAWPAIAQESPAALKFHVAGGISGFGAYRQNVWAPVRSEVINPTGVDQQPLIIASIKDEPWLQFASRTWVPAGTRRVVPTMLCWTSQTPVEGKNNAVELDMLLVDDSQSPEREDDRTISLLPARDQSSSLALYASSDKLDSRDFLEQTLASSNPNKLIHALTRSRTPGELEAWAAIEATVLAKPVASLNHLQIDAIRHWLWSGGRLWLMLDQLDEATPEALLGSQWNAAVLDQVDLTHVEVFKDMKKDSKDDPLTQVDLDYPVRMSRVMLEDDSNTKVLYTIDGYPAAWWQTVGQGQLLVTTVGQDAWGGQDADATRRFGQFLTRGLSSSMIQRGDTDGPADDPLTRYVTQQVGHEVLGVAPVAGLLGLMTFGLLGGGVFLMRIGRLEWSAALAVGLVAVCSVALILIGRAKQAQTPGVVAIGSMLDVHAPADAADARTSIQVYRPPGGSADVTLAVAGPLPAIDRGQLVGRNQLRFIQTDRDQWHFQNLDLPPGVVRTLQLNGESLMPPDLRVVGTFDAAGLVLDAQLPDGQTLSDPLVVTPTGLLSPTRRDDGRLAATPGDEVTYESPFESAMLSQRQIQRQAVYQDTLTAQTPVHGPMLMGWLPQAPVAVTLRGDDIPLRADTLASLPIQLVCPPAGQRVTVPPALLDVSSFRDPSLAVSSTVYDDSRRQFIPGNTGQAVALQFTLPNALAGLQLESVKLNFDLVCPNRDYEVFVLAEGQLRTVLNGRGAMGRQTIELTADDLPSITEGHQLIVGIRVHDVPPGEPSPTWSIQQLFITPTGVMPSK